LFFQHLAFFVEFVSAVTVIKAAKHLFKRRLLETSIAPTSSTSELRALFGILDRLTSADLAERRLRLAEQRATQKDQK
jgi:hypothetical protein